MLIVGLVEKSRTHLLFQLLGIPLNNPRMGVKHHLSPIDGPIGPGPKLLAVIDDDKPGKLGTNDADTDFERFVPHCVLLHKQTAQ